MPTKQPTSSPPTRPPKGAAGVPDLPEPKEGDLAVWWIPQVPMQSFLVPVESAEEAAIILEVLAQYDIFQYENMVKPDYSNAGGILTFTDGEWESSCEDDDYRDGNIDKVLEARISLIRRHWRTDK